jgi:hypothetical protein
MCLRPAFPRHESTPLWREPRGDPLAVRQLEIDTARGESGRLFVWL